jgi:hypothetical protein
MEVLDRRFESNILQLRSLLPLYRRWFGTEIASQFFQQKHVALLVVSDTKQ